MEDIAKSLVAVVQGTILCPVDDIVGYVQSESRECCQYLHGVSLQE